MSSEIKIVKQNILLPIKNIVVDRKKDENTYKHSKLLPNSIRCIVCGPSGSGKTNVMINLLEDANGLKFENVYIYSKSLFQPKYLYLHKIMSSIKGMGFFTFSSNNDVIPIENVRPNSIFIFDDVICSKQNNIRDYFCMGRHKGVDSFYLSQSYAHIPKHLIRENANLLILFRQDDLSLKHIYNDFSISVDMSFDDFKKMNLLCWNTDDKHGFMVIDVENSPTKGKYRMQFDKFIQLMD